MSNEALDWAWSQNLKSAPKLVLLCLADHADDAWNCWPSLRRLASLTGLDRSTITRNISGLTELGLIERDRSAGGYGKPTRYRLLKRVHSATVLDNENGCTRSQNGCTRSQKRVHSAPRTLKNHQEPLGGALKRAHTLSDDFSLTAEMKAWGSEKYPSIDHQRETEKFIDHAKANNRKLVDWAAAWRNWIRKADEFSKERQTTKQPPADRTIPAGEYF